jgi:hypothetical protein
MSDSQIARYPLPETFDEFLDVYVLYRPELVLTIKSTAGASINVDGPFEREIFQWSVERPATGVSDEVVLQPRWATRRPGSSETSVHLHFRDALQGKSECFVRLWYAGSKLIDHDVRICFFTDRPQQRSGEELFWFYGFTSGPFANPVCELLPRGDTGHSPVHALRL